MFRILLGLVTATLCALAVSFAAGCILGIYASGSELNSIWVLGAAVAWGASLFLIPAILLLTVPLHRLAIKLSRVRATDYAVVGGLVGILTLLLALTGLGGFLEFPGPMMKPALVIAPLLGAVTALGFWIVTRPDQVASA